MRAPGALVLDTPVAVVGVPGRCSVNEFGRRGDRPADVERRPFDALELRLGLDDSVSDAGRDIPIRA